MYEAVDDPPSYTFGSVCMDDPHAVSVAVAIPVRAAIVVRVRVRVRVFGEPVRMLAPPSVVGVSGSISLRANDAVRLHLLSESVDLLDRKGIHALVFGVVVVTPHPVGSDVVDLPLFIHLLPEIDVE